MEIYAIFLVFILGDIVTGLLKAAYHGKISSKCLRKGLIHKFTEILVVFGCGYIDFLMLHYFEQDFKLLETSQLYVITMELISIIENISQINPKLGNFLKPYLELLKEKEKENKDEGNWCIKTQRCNKL